MSHSGEIDVEDAFDRKWASFRGPEGILNFVSSFCRVPPCDEVASGLVQIDIERHWMQWERDFQQVRDQESAQALVAKMKSIPSLRDYLNAGFDQLGVKPWSQQIATCERDARRVWGDCIGESYFRDELQVVIPTVPEVIWMRCIQDGSRERTQERLPILGETSVGRRRGRERDHAKSCIQRPEGNRLLIASHSLNEISREHLRVQVLKPNCVAITNTSELNAVIVFNVGKLEPGFSLVVDLPFQTRIHDRTLFFETDAGQ